jgi:hypothetical protein
MPPQNRVGGDDRGDLTQQPTAETVLVPRQPAPVLLGQPEASSAQLRSEDPVLFDQIPQGLLPLVAPPARNGHQHESKRDNVHHGGSLQDRPNVQTGTSAENWDTTRPSITSRSGSCGRSA